MQTASSSRIIELTENETSAPQYLTNRELQQLSQITFQASNDQKASLVVVPIASNADGFYKLRARSIVGSFSVGHTTVRVRPKIGEPKTIDLLNFGFEFAKFPTGNSAVGVASSLNDFIVRSFLDSIEDLVEAGFPASYNSVTERGHNPRGRIDFSKSMLSVVDGRLLYEFDDIGHASPELEVIAYALRRLWAVPDVSTASVRRIKKYSRLILPLVPIETSNLFWRMLRLPSAADRSEVMSKCLELAQLIISGNGASMFTGSHKASSFLIDMNRVFESFVISAVKRSVFTGYDVDVKGSKYPRFFSRADKLKVEPDFSAWSDGSCVFVGDAKYKLLSHKRTIVRSDLYQAFAYATALNTRVAILFYVGDLSARTLETTFAKVSITVAPLDLEKMDIDDVSKFMNGLIAQRTRESIRSSTMYC